MRSLVCLSLASLLTGCDTEIGYPCSDSDECTDNAICYKGPTAYPTRAFDPEKRALKSSWTDNPNRADVKPGKQYMKGGACALRGAAEENGPWFTKDGAEIDVFSY